MNREKLIEKASRINSFSQSLIDEYESKREKMVQEVNDAMSQREDITSLIGENNKKMMHDNHTNHARFVVSILHDFDPAILTNTVLWVFRAYKSHYFTENYWAAQLNTWIDVLRTNLSQASFNEIYPLYNWFIVNIPHFSDLSETALHKQSEDYH